MAGDADSANDASALASIIPVPRIIWGFYMSGTGIAWCSDGGQMPVGFGGSAPR